MFEKMMGGAPKDPNPFEKPKKEKIDSATMERLLNGVYLGRLRSKLIDDVKKKSEEYKKSEAFDGSESEIGVLNNLDDIIKELENEKISNSDLLMLKSLIDVL